MTGNPAVAKKKLDEIMGNLGLTMNTEKTRIVRAEEVSWLYRQITIREILVFQRWFHGGHTS